MINFFGKRRKNWLKKIDSKINTEVIARLKFVPEGQYIGKNIMIIENPCRRYGILIVRWRTHIQPIFKCLVIEGGTYSKFKFPNMIQYIKNKKNHRRISFSQECLNIFKII